MTPPLVGRSCVRFIWISRNSHFLPTNDEGGGKHGPAAFVGLLGEDVIKGPGVAATPEKHGVT